LSDFKEVVITPSDLDNKTILQTNITLERSCETLLTGIIYNEGCVPVEGAVIEVIAVYYRNYRVKLGYVITNQGGEFALAVTKNDFINYHLNIYEPLLKG
jgi:hypothetical protein